MILRERLKEAALDSTILRLTPGEATAPQDLLRLILVWTLDTRLDFRCNQKFKLLLATVRHVAIRRRVRLVQLLASRLLNCSRIESSLEPSLFCIHQSKYSVTRFARTELHSTGIKETQARILHGK
ncbi:unnamed protein product [Lasius platythorax]|uniref:Uncharacterized protein n=1 Tax=Lasius platythorax TaxID=488582 RepID=A0AAV2NMW8_9HYME